MFCFLSSFFYLSSSPFPPPSTQMEFEFMVPNEGYQRCLVPELYPLSDEEKNQFMLEISYYRDHQEVTVNNSQAFLEDGLYIAAYFGDIRYILHAIRMGAKDFSRMQWIVMLLHPENEYLGRFAQDVVSMSQLKHSKCPKSSKTKQYQSKEGILFMIDYLIKHSTKHAGSAALFIFFRCPDYQIFTDLQEQKYIRHNYWHSRFEDARCLEKLKRSMLP